MARPQKEGLEYFPLEVDMDADDKIILVEAKHGVAGFGIIIKLLMKIYREGYYYKWSEKEQLIFSKRVNVDINTVTEVVSDAVRWSLFSSNMFDRYGILTSCGIQKRYLKATHRRQRIEMEKSYLLLDNQTINDYNNLVIVSRNGVNGDTGTQSKVKYSTGEKSTVQKDLSSEQGPDGGDEKLSEPGYRKDTPPFRAANYLRKAILSNNPRARVPTDKEEDSLMQRWAQEMDRLNRLGPPGGSKGYTWDEVKKIIDFCMDDSFWQSNILSPAKLREKIVILENKMKERAKSGNIGGKGKKDSRPGFRPSQHDWSSEPDRI